MQKIKIADDRYIGDGESCFIIAEVGVNHNGSIDIAKKMIDAAKSAGVDAVKFQTFKGSEFVSDSKQTYTYKSQGKEITESMIEMFKRYEFNQDEWREIIDYCTQSNILFLTTPQNLSDLELILSIKKLLLIKVGADDLTNLPLLESYASKGIPMFISAGMAYAAEIDDAVRAIRNAGNEDIIVLHCVSSYPAEPEEVNLHKMESIRNTFNVITGFSDHTAGNYAAITAAALGASIIEKHFTLDKEMPGPDHWFSSNPNELKALVEGIRYAEKCLGNKMIKPTDREVDMRKIARRSIVAARDILAGEKLSKENITYKRPGTGLPPKFSEYIIGKTARLNIKKNEIIDFNKL